jgi:hypothetical protein
MKPSPRSRKQANLSDSVLHRLNMYAVAASAAGVGMVVSPQAAEGKIVYTPANVNLNGKPFPLDLNHDHRVDFFLFVYTYGFGHSQFLQACHHPVFRFSRTVCYASTFGSNALNAIRVSRSSKGDTFAAELRPGAKIQGGERFG